MCLQRATFVQENPYSKGGLGFAIGIPLKMESDAATKLLSRGGAGDPHGACHFPCCAAICRATILAAKGRF